VAEGAAARIGGQWRDDAATAAPGEPNYAEDAVRAKIQGTVLRAWVVNTAREVTDIKILRSLDPTIGLGRERSRLPTVAIQSGFATRRVEVGEELIEVIRTYLH